MPEGLRPCPEDIEDEPRLARYIMTGKLTLARHLAANPIDEMPGNQILQHFEPWENKVRAADAIVSCDVVFEDGQGSPLTLIIGPGFDEADGGTMSSLVEYLGQIAPESYFETKRCGPVVMVCASGKFTEMNFMERRDVFYGFLKCL